MISVAEARVVAAMLDLTAEQLADACKHEAHRKLASLDIGYALASLYGDDGEARRWLLLSSVFEQLWEADHPEEEEAAAGGPRFSEQEAKPDRLIATAAAADRQSTDKRVDR